MRKSRRNRNRLAVIRSVVGQAHDYPDRLRMHAYNISVGFTSWSWCVKESRGATRKATVRLTVTTTNILKVLYSTCIRNSNHTPSSVKSRASVTSHFIIRCLFKLTSGKFMILQSNSKTTHRFH